MGKTIRTAMRYEQMPDQRKPHISRRTLIRQEQRWDKLPTREILRRLYVRHDVLVWEAITVVTWVWLIVRAI